MDRHTGGLRWRVAELHSRGSLNYLYGALLGFLWPIILICLLQSSYLIRLSILACVYTHLLAKMYSTEDASLTKEAKDLYTEKCKILMKETEKNTRK